MNIWASTRCHDDPRGSGRGPVAPDRDRGAGPLPRGVSRRSAGRRPPRRAREPSRCNGRARGRRHHHPGGLPARAGPAGGMRRPQRPYQQAPSAVRAAIACEIDRVRVSKGLRWLRDDRRPSWRRGATPRTWFDVTLLAPQPERWQPERPRASGGVHQSGLLVERRRGLAWGTANRGGSRAAPARHSTAASTVRAWLRSPGHRAIILSSSYDDGGVGTRTGTPAGHAAGVTVTVVAGRRDC